MFSPDFPPRARNHGPASWKLTRVGGRKKTVGRTREWAQSEGPRLPKERIFFLHVDAKRPRRDQAHVVSGLAAGTRTVLRGHYLLAGPRCSSPLPAARPDRSWDVTANHPCFSRVLGQATAGRGTGQTKPLSLRIITPEALPGVWETSACRVSPPFWRPDWIFVVFGPRRCKTTNSMPREQRNTGSDGDRKVPPRI